MEEAFGREHSFDVETVAEALSALRVNYPNFRQLFLANEEYYFVGKRSEEEVRFIGEVHSRLFNDEELHIVPKLEGEYVAPLFAIIAAKMMSVVTGATMGVSVLSISVAAQIGGFILQTVVMSALSFGISKLTSKTPDVSDYDSRENTKPSFLFNGALNRTEQGGPKQLIFGRFMVGSTRVSGSIKTERIVRGKVVGS
jgi:predicted phage tail protein